MQHEADEDANKSQVGNVRSAAKKALLQLLEPLAGFVLDAGLSTSELHAIFREAAVRSVVARQLEICERVNISGIAAITGIPRADISRILKLNANVSSKPDDGQQQSTNCILAAWHDDPKFTRPNGQPADLKLYGRGATFEALAKRYGRGIPTRAVLDELVRTGALELLASQKVRVKASVAVERGVSARVIKAFGDRATELLSTMLLNMRQPKTPKFMASISNVCVLPSSLPLFRKELSVKGADFLAEVQEGLLQKARSSRSRFREHGDARVSVTIFCHESIEKKSNEKNATNKRRNFRREV